MTSEFPVALVTGSTSGIGLEIARKLAEKRYAVVVNSRFSSETGMRIAEDLPLAIYIQADLSVETDRQRLIEQVLHRYGRLDVLVNNAGISRVIPHEDLLAVTSSVWNELNAVNLIAPFHLVALAEAALRKSGEAGNAGCVVNISSHAGVRPKGASIPYAATKAALNHVTKLLALSLAPKIRVNAVAPGLVDTPLTAEWVNAQELWRNRSPMRRAATPADIANVVISLVDNPYLTGEIIMADGGLNLT
ncbi:MULTISPECIES: SDR family oxidoreductase [unclassified Herbaspirillum]|uniref:SDR family NAD(P)-dependent oxidoreductase n=1 Tax=unclassified Herbaspirillum TaxID=2624150 RepID=UPI000E2E8916|nr:MULTISPECIES: SDR family oxidoreductase [unclassified Herbaspirillum]RFB70866.1 SDR family oxidoreductase [Herbaspirillum sp. 3R-3a1]TFI08610.1 SDR family oxidoreductase [Herbaspirillum sp. 3R11]TFI15025.1 SDR family oxidoreductase [Herbaspirillum sp. 3R-11]TFI25415.1 SDR family oxidoreductase [Herbaspirillum sp. 3C11]